MRREWGIGFDSCLRISFTCGGRVQLVSMMISTALRWEDRIGQLGEWP